MLSGRRELLRGLLAGAILPSFVTGATSATGPTGAPRTRREWESYRAATRRGMEQVMGELPLSGGPPVFGRREVFDHPRFTRTRLSCRVDAPGDLPAWLLIPKGLTRRAPAMLCLHQTTRLGKDEPVGLGGLPNLHYAAELAARGYVCIVPDYPYLGENNQNPYLLGYQSCTMKGIVNHRRAVDILAGLPEVDRRRLGVIGHSLGGHNALFVAAFDPRLRAVVTSCGFTSFPKYMKGNLTAWAGDRYMPLIATRYQKDPARMPFDFPALLISLAPRALFINAPLHDDNFDHQGVRDCVAAAHPVYHQIFKAGARIITRYPDAGHDFPTPIREEAYQALDRWLSA